jgi:peptide chain release factor 2
LSSSGGFFDVAAGKKELGRIEEQASSPDFWNDQEGAQKLLQKRTILEKKIQRQELFNSQISDAGVLFEFAEEDEES